MGPIPRLCQAPLVLPYGDADNEDDNDDDVDDVDDVDDDDDATTMMTATPTSGK